MPTSTLWWIYTDTSSHFSVGGESHEGLAFDPTTQTLYGAFDGQFRIIDPADGSIIQVLPSAGADVEGLAYGNGYVYGLVGMGLGGGTPGDLMRYDISQNKWENLGNTGIPQSDEVGLAFDPLRNTLYAVTGRGTELYSIDPDTAVATVVGDTGLLRGGGLAYVVPEPISSILLVTGGATLAVRHYLKRRKRV